MGNVATEDRASVEILVGGREATAEICSISSSGLATLEFRDPPGVFAPLLDRAMQSDSPIRLRTVGSCDPLSVDVNLVCFETSDQANPQGGRIELIVDGSGCEGWSRLFALSRISG